MWDPLLGIEPGAPVLGLWSLSPWATREIPGLFIIPLPEADTGRLPEQHVSADPAPPPQPC